MSANPSAEPADAPNPAATGDEPDPVRATAHALFDAARLGQLLVTASGLLAVGGTLQGAPFPPALRTLGLVGFALAAGWATGWAARVVAAVLHALADRSEAAARLDDRLDALAGAVGSARAAAPPASAATEGERKAVALADTRRAVREARWEDAAALAAGFAEAFPGDPAADRLDAELTEARGRASRELTARLAAARETGDADRVIELREELRALAEPGSLADLDRDLARWFMSVIHRRLRTGTVRPDVAALAGRVAGALDGTPEGASLRASLPTLRRAAGLCPRCAGPYKGIAEACPECVKNAATATATATPIPTAGATAAPTTPVPAPAPEDDPDELPAGPVESIFVHDDLDDDDHGPGPGPRANGAFPSDKTKDFPSPPPPPT